MRVLQKKIRTFWIKTVSNFKTPHVITREITDNSRVVQSISPALPQPHTHFLHFPSPFRHIQCSIQWPIPLTTWCSSGITNLTCLNLDHPPPQWPRLSRWCLHPSMSSGQQPQSLPIASIAPTFHTWSIWSTANSVDSAFKIYPLLLTPSQVPPCRSTPPSLFLACIISVSPLPPLSSVYSQMNPFKHRSHHVPSLFRTFQCLLISE